MFGNLIGWVIAAILGAVALTLMIIINILAGVTFPSDFIKNPANTALIAQPPRTDALVAMRNASLDGGAIYRQAIAEYLKDKAFYDDYKIEAVTLGRLKAVDLLLDATHSAKADIFRSQPAKVISYVPTPPEIEAIEQLGLLASQVAAYYRKDKPDESRKYAEALFALGRHLTDERLTFREFQAGMGMMSAAARIMGPMRMRSGNAVVALPPLNPDAEEWYKAYQAMSEPLPKRHQALRFIDKRLIKQHAGDVFWFARNKNMDQMWRVEAILMIGQLKRDAIKRADKVAAPIVLRKLKEENNPVIKVAAQVALDAQDRDLNQQGGR